MAWHRLRPEQTKRATIKVFGGPDCGYRGRQYRLQPRGFHQVKYRWRKKMSKYCANTSTGNNPTHFFFPLSAGRRSFRSASSEKGF